MGYAELIAAIMGMIDTAATADEKKKLMADGMNALDRLGVPELKEALAEQLSRPEAAKQDPMLAEAQRQALAKMQGFASGEISQADRAQMALAQNEAARRGQTQQAAILRGAQQQGQLGGGAQLAMQQQAARGQSDAAYQAALQNMTDLRNRQFNAIGQTANMSGQMSQQDFQRKGAADQVAAANAAARQGARQYNLGIGQRDWENRLKAWGLKTGRQDLSSKQEAEASNQRRSDYGNMAAGFSNLAGDEEDEKQKDVYSV